MSRRDEVLDRAKRGVLRKLGVAQSNLTREQRDAVVGPGPQVLGKLQAGRAQRAERQRELEGTVVDDLSLIHI